MTGIKSELNRLTAQNMALKLVYAVGLTGIVFVERRIGGLR